MSKKVVLLELHYLPSIEYFSYIYHFDTIYIEAQENYQKQSYRNRCKIKGANKIESLIVPIQHRKYQKITDVKIDYNQKWMGVHKRAIMSAYGNAPFFDYFSQDLLGVYRVGYNKLFDLNMALLTKCLELLGIHREIKFTDSFDKSIKNSQIDARGVIHPKKSLGKPVKFRVVAYDQIFGSNFAANLSIVDLLFCVGNRSTDILKKSLQIK